MKQFLNKALLGLAGLGLAASGLVGCSDKNEMYEVNPPSDLDERIATAAANRPVEVVGESAEGPYRIGEKDFSSGWFKVFSKYYELGKNDTLIVKFKNYSDCKANYHNYAVYVSNDVDIQSDGYTEIAGQRADRWDNHLGESAVFDGNMVSGLPDDEAWTAWKNDMKKADVTVKVIRDKDGAVSIYTNSVISDTKIWECNQLGLAFDEEIARVFFPCENAYLEFYYSNKEGKLDPKSTIIEGDLMATKLEVTGAPKAVELGSKDYWKDAKVFITWENGVTTELSSKDVVISTTAPINEAGELTTVGQYTVTASYAKTKNKEAADPVSISFIIEVINPIVDFRIENIADQNYYIAGESSIDLNGAKVIAIAKDGSESEIDLDNIETPTIKIKDGANDATFKLKEKDIYYTTKVNFVKASVIGDVTVGWNTLFTNRIKIAKGESIEFSFNIEEAGGAGNWQSALYYVYADASANNTEPLFAFRTDNWPNINNETLGHTRDCGWTDPDEMEDYWENFASSVAGSTYTVKVTNNGNKKASIVINIVDGKGKSRIQKFEEIGITEDDFYFAVSLEAAKLKF